MTLNSIKIVISFKVVFELEGVGLPNFEVGHAVISERSENKVWFTTVRR